MADEYDWHYPGSGTPPVTAPEKLTVEQVGQDRRTVKALWVAHGGEQHGPIVEHYSIEEQAFYRFVDALLAHHRQQAEARPEGLIAAARALAISAGKLNVALDRLEKFRRHKEALVRDMTIFADALTAYRSARP